jgi:Eco57I restriction-modification methylase
MRCVPSASRGTGKIRRAVDYHNLGSEELGSIYEALLELDPRINVDVAAFELGTVGGHERKTTGSYYTPSGLIQCLLDSALDPVLAEAVRKPRPEVAILDLKICDPACGSGHFLIAAAHRIARRLAAVRTGDEESSPEAMRAALRDVISRCIYGVDVNEMAVELCKISLWMEALEPGRPLSFLDHRIICGNSLLGTTPALMAGGIPDDVFIAIEGDDKTITAALRKRNRREREGQMTLPMVAEPGGQYAVLSTAFASLNSTSDDSIETVHLKEQRFDGLLASTGYRKARLLADAWCAAFAWLKTKSAVEAVTDDVFQRLASDSGRVPTEICAEINALAQRYRFFHWHLAFPDVFRLPGRGEEPENSAAGWTGGFDVVIGNPPWEAEELIEKEFFAASFPEIVTVRTKAKRTSLIQQLRELRPELFDAWLLVRREFAVRSHFFKSSARYELGSAGKLNTYRLFAELAASLVSFRGRVGQVLKTGIINAQDSQPLFAEWLKKERIVSAYDFINTRQIFPGVVGNERFCLLTLAGLSGRAGSARYAFTLETVEDLQDQGRAFEVSKDELQILNPIDLSVPPASSAYDYQLLVSLHRRAKPLRADATTNNPWRVHYAQGHLNSAADSSMFTDLTFEQLLSRGCVIGHDEHFRIAADVYVPLYEGKFIAQMNHRFSTFEDVPQSRRFGVKAEAVSCPDPLSYEIRTLRFALGIGWEPSRRIIYTRPRPRGMSGSSCSEMSVERSWTRARCRPVSCRGDHVWMVCRSWSLRTFRALRLPPRCISTPFGPRSSLITSLGRRSMVHISRDKLLTSYPSHRRRCCVSMSVVRLSRALLLPEHWS